MYFSLQSTPPSQDNYFLTNVSSALNKLNCYMNRLCRLEISAWLLKTKNFEILKTKAF